MTLRYASAFVHLPREKGSFENVPTSYPNPPHAQSRQQQSNPKSFSVFGRGRSKSTTAQPPPPPPQHARTKSKGNVAKRNKAKYPLRPAPLANELALAQFMDGGSMEANIQRFNESQAKALACSGQSMGVGDVYRDGKGGIWLDQDEEWEYAGLLGGDEEEEGPQWVEFGNHSSSTINAAINIDLAGDERRASIYSQDSDLDPRFIVEQQDELAAFGGALSPIVLRRPNTSVYSVPPRPRRGSNYPHQPEFWPDGAVPFSGPPTNCPPGVYHPSSRGADRRRHAPQAWAPPSPRAWNPAYQTDKLRRDFLDGSFEPEPTVGRPPPPSYARRGSSGSILQPTNMSHPPTQQRSMSKKSSKLNMKGLFRRG